MAYLFRTDQWCVSNQPKLKDTFTFWGQNVTTIIRQAFISVQQSIGYDCVGRRVLREKARSPVLMLMVAFVVINLFPLTLSFAGLFRLSTGHYHQTSNFSCSFCVAKTNKLLLFCRFNRNLLAKFIIVSSMVCSSATSTSTIYIRKFKCNDFR